MSQPRVRKMLGSVADIPRARTSVAKASGDSMACPIRQHQEILPSRSKNKIPKSVRYDLENALVGLCDVWFEEIKPYLVRNKIKLHVKGSCAAGDLERPPSVTPTRTPPPGPLTPGCCSHLDPGAAPDDPRQTASCTGSFSMPPTASRAPCVRLRTPSRRPLSPLLSMPQTPRDCPQIQPLNYEEKKLKRRCIRRKHRRFQPQPQPSWRVPRLCRTYTVLCQAGAGSRAGSRTTMIASRLPPSPSDDYYRFIVPRRESVMKNKTTQTDQALCVSRGCQSRSPWSRRPRSPCPGSCRPDPLSSKCSPSCKSKPISPDCAAPPLIVPPPNIISRLRQSEATVAEIPSLLQDDLIVIITEGNEKRLRLLYSSSENDNHPSYMNLFPNRQQKTRDLKKLPPWR